MQIKHQNRILNLDTPKIMGILNVTPDSFSDGGQWNAVDKALEHAQDMIAAGASIIDIGGESTRPGAAFVSVEEEISRVIPVVKALREHNSKILISIDTSQPEVITEAIQAGADIWNDIRALTVKDAVATASKLQIPVILMHMQGTPFTMQNHPHYDDTLSEVIAFLQERVEICLNAGIKRENIILDPGFGFGKSVNDNFTLLNHLEDFVNLGYPLLSALSRKSMLGAACNLPNPQDRLIGSVAGALISFMKGAQMVRVHDVKETRQALEIYLATVNA